MKSRRFPIPMNGTFAVRTHPHTHDFFLFPSHQNFLLWIESEKALPTDDFETRQNSDICVIIAYTDTLAHCSTECAGFCVLNNQFSCIAREKRENVIFHSSRILLKQEFLLYFSPRFVFDTNVPFFLLSPDTTFLPIKSCLSQNENLFF